jgi:ribosome-associated toxin RatA of RatAB toxin-antitoxin module
MAKAQHQEKFSISKNKYFEAVTAYEKYPHFVDGVSSVKVERKGAGKARVTYEIELMGQKMNYVLDHTEDREKGSVEWHLVESNFFKVNTGKWKISGDEKGCDVTYDLEVEFKISVPGFILNRLVKGSLPTMVQGFGKQAQKT